MGKNHEAATRQTKSEKELTRRANQLLARMEDPRTSTKQVIQLSEELRAVNEQLFALQ